MNGTLIVIGATGDGPVAASVGGHVSDDERRAIDIAETRAFLMLLRPLLETTGMLAVPDDRGDVPAGSVVTWVSQHHDAPSVRSRLAELAGRADIEVVSVSTLAIRAH